VIYLKPPAFAEDPEAILQENGRGSEDAATTNGGSVHGSKNGSTVAIATTNGVVSTPNPAVIN
jgi:hypothetical protein